MDFIVSKEQAHCIEILRLMKKSWDVLLVSQRKRRATALKKLNAKLAIQNTDRITIHNTGDRIEFYYNNSNKREGATYFYEIPFSLSIKKYFGCHGRTIGELYDFKAWYNKKLTSVVTTLFRELEHSLTNAKTLAARQEVICYER